jgi:tetratricopeptide (TPR) repeat protein
MRILVRCLAAVVVVLLAFTASDAGAASTTDFYLNLLRRGIADLAAGRNDQAARELRTAAFGLLERIDQYEIAHVYLAIASDRLGNDGDAKQSVQKIVVAERVQRRYATLDLPADIRTAFEKIAATTLAPDQLATLRKPAGVQPAPVIAPVPQPARPQPQPVRPAPVPVPVPQPTRPQPQPQPVPQTPIPQPARPQPQPVQPAPVPVTPVPQPARPQPQPQPARPQPAPQPPPVIVPQPVPQPKPVPVTPVPLPAPARRYASVAEINGILQSGERALERNDLVAARTLYRDALERAPNDHGMLLLVAEGLYRSRDFANVTRAFDRAIQVSPIRTSEEPYRYYLAVALYETGQLDAARRELKTVLPYIEETPDVRRYRLKIEGAIR